MLTEKQKAMKKRFRKIRQGGKTHYTFVVKGKNWKSYKPICIPNGRLYARYKDKNCEVTCEKCLAIINDQK